MGLLGHARAGEELSIVLSLCLCCDQLLPGLDGQLGGVSDCGTSWDGVTSCPQCCHEVLAGLPGDLGQTVRQVLLGGAEPDFCDHLVLMDGLSDLENVV